MTFDIAALRSGGAGRTKDFEYVRGEYAIAGELVPYFAISMSVNEAIQHLTLASNLAVDPTDPVKLDELIQRDVKRSRTDGNKGEIVNYLKAPDRLKFFNSFTVVLMPLDENKRPTSAFAQLPADQPNVTTDEQGLEVTQAGAVRIRQVPGQSFGFLSWDTGSAAAVVIDGQHRFLALKAVKDELPQHLRPDQTRIPLLVLVLDKQAGFKGVGEEPGNVVKASRSIFTDINKYAVKVSAEREYLLDDLSLKAVSMRRLITNSIGNTTQDVVAAATRVPLAVVDWASSRQVKFEDGPFVSSVQAMHTLVAGLLGNDISAEPDPTNHADMVTWVETIYARLAIDDNAWDQSAILGRIQRAEDESMPFRLSSNEVQAAARAFADGVGQVCVQLLMRATPYKILIDRYLADGFLGGDAEYWLGQGENAREGWVTQFGRDPAADARLLYEEVKGDYVFAYLVVFQRAFVLSGRDLYNLPTEVLAEWGVEDDASQDVLIQTWLQRFNEVVAPLLSRDCEDFWLGTAVKADRRVDYGARGLNSTSGLTKLLLLPPSEPKPVDGEDLKLLAGEENDDVLALLDNDPYRIATPTAGQLAWVGIWRASLDSIARGRAAGGDFGQLRRTAVRQYRDGLRSHITQVASAASRPLTDEQRDRLVLAFGARRLASVLAKD
jgi:hypothetical protein